MKDNIVFKRFLAYLIDFFVVAAIASCISYIPFLNPEREHYASKYNEVMELFNQYEQEEISKEDYEKEYISLSYELNRLNINYMVINLIVMIAYFGVYQWQAQGQTIGKRVMKIKVVTRMGDSNPRFLAYFVRTVILNNIIITALQMGVILLFQGDTYYKLYSNINLVGYVLLYILLFLLLVRVDHCGLHDLIASTKVVDMKKAKEDTILEAQYEEVGKQKAKKKSTKTKK